MGSGFSTFCSPYEIAGFFSNNPRGWGVDSLQVKVGEDILANLCNNPLGWGVDSLLDELFDMIRGSLTVTIPLGGEWILYVKTLCLICHKFL